MEAAESVWKHFFPGSTLQERHWNVSYYLAKYGSDWIGDLISEAERDPLTPRHLWVYLS